MTTSAEALKRTALHGVHAKLGGKLVPFAGWEMPLYYGNITDEHHAVRRAAGLFDLGHMGRIAIRGDDRVAFLDRIVTNAVAGLAVGRARYGLVCNEGGTVLDDVIYYILEDEILLVVNASNREKIVAWLEKHRPDGISFEDQTDATAMIAPQGPAAAALLTEHSDIDIASIKYYRIASGTVLGVDARVARTGYTGEDGFEIYFDAAHAEKLWTGLSDAGRDAGMIPCGLGARDTLRTEAGMPLYGHEIDEATNPLEAGLDFAVKLDKDFIGRDALQAVKDAGGPKRRLRGFHVAGKRIPRPDYELFAKDGGDAAVGRCTSGTFSPTLGKPICIATIDASVADDAALTVDVRGSRIDLEAVPMPFYKRPKKK